MVKGNRMNQSPGLPHGFSTEEFKDRFIRLHDEMSIQRIEAILLTTEADITYFSGISSQFWESPTRPIFLIITTEHGTPIAVVPDIMKETFADSWIPASHTHTWPSPSPTEDDGVTLLVEQLRPYKQIGMPMGPETSLRMPLRDFDAIRDKLADTGTTFHDVTQMVRGVRMVKSRAEIQKIRIACQLASASFAALPGILGARTTRTSERDAVREMTVDMIQRGIDRVKYIVGKSGTNGYTSVVCGASDKVLQPGEVFVIDTGGVYDRYFCDFNRNYLIVGKGEPEPAHNAYLESHHHMLWDATECGLAVAKPNVTVGDVWKAMTDHLIAQGIDSKAFDTGRQGHFLGSQLTELPSVVAHETTVLRAGMVLTLEPGVPLRDGKCLVHEECVVITEDGCELLSDRAPRDMARIPVSREYDQAECRVVFNDI